LDEFVEVSQRPKFRKYFSLNDLQDLLTEIKTKAIFIIVTSAIDICRDTKDNFLLSLAVDGQATHILTGDKDLLALHPMGKTQILTIAEYMVAQ